MELTMFRVSKILGHEGRGGVSNITIILLLHLDTYILCCRRHFDASSGELRFYEEIGIKKIGKSRI